MNRPRLYDFTLADGAHLRVHPRTERYAEIINMETGQIMRALWLQEATLTEADGTRREITIESKSVRRLRYRARKAEESKRRRCAGCQCLVPASFFARDPAGLRCYLCLPLTEDERALVDTMQSEAGA